MEALFWIIGSTVGNGSLAIITFSRDEPFTSIPSQKAPVARRDDVSSLENSSFRRLTSFPSSWTNILYGLAFFFKR